MSLDVHSIAEEADRQGRIVIKLERGRLAVSKRKEDGRVHSFDPQEYFNTDATCSKVVQKHHVSHTLKYVATTASRPECDELTAYRQVPLRPSSNKPSTSSACPRTWVCAEGEAGEPIVFTLRYRSRGKLYQESPLC